MASLKAMCDDEEFTLSQRTYFWEEVKRLSSQKVHDGVAISCLSRLWDSYDKGGHSAGRSLRSVLLDQIIPWLRDGEKDKAKVALSVLTSMYFDYEYINHEKWFDFHLESKQDLPLGERILLCTAAFSLDIIDIPAIVDWPKDRIYRLVKG